MHWINVARREEEKKPHLPLCSTELKPTNQPLDRNINRYFIQRHLNNQCLAANLFVNLCALAIYFNIDLRLEWHVNPS